MVSYMRDAWVFSTELWQESRDALVFQHVIFISRPNCTSVWLGSGLELVEFEEKWSWMRW